MYEFILSGGGFEFTAHAFQEFVTIVLIGLALGTLAAFLLFYMIKSELVPHFLLNVFTLALVLLVFVFSDSLAYESGLLTVVVMGTVLGNLDVPRINEILYFKESLSVLLISILFILLAANIDIEELQLLLDWRCLALFLVVVFLLRPAGVFASTNKSGLTFRDKLFISWVGPRGIVAAGIASLFGLKLIGVVPGAEYITPLVFMIVLGTVLLNATTAKPLAKLLKVTLDASNGILIVGANMAARVIGKYLQDHGRHVILVDNSKSNVDTACEEGLETFQANIFQDQLDEQFELLDMGFLLALTSSTEVNEYALKKYQKIFGERGAYRIMTPNEMTMEKVELPKDVLISYSDDFINISEVARDYPNWHEVPVQNVKDFKVLLEELSNQPKCIPLFLKHENGMIDFISTESAELDFSHGISIVYLGVKLEKLLPLFAS